MNATLDSLLERYPALSACADEIVGAYELLSSVFRGGNKLLVCGNGGSAADSDHIVAELMKGFKLPRPLDPKVRERLLNVSRAEGNRLADQLQGALPVISLASHGALLTAVANDVAPDMGFAQQVFGYGVKGDALLAISTSGDSPNVLNALMVARAEGLRTVGLTGSSGGAMGEFCDVLVRVPATETSHVQELHLPVYHALSEALEAEFFA